jgi:hypothetical protein
MMNRSIVWSAYACPIVGAGSYVGLSSSVQQNTVSRMLFPRRAAPYTGSTVRVRQDDLWPLLFLAVRDPSAVRVIPSRAAVPAEGMRRVMLQFGFEHSAHSLSRLPQWEDTTATNELRLNAEERVPAAFVLTIGLPIRLEQTFHEAVMHLNRGRVWPELCHAVTEAGRRVMNETGSRARS